MHGVFIDWGKMDVNPPFSFCRSSIYGVAQLFGMTLTAPLRLLRDLEVKRRNTNWRFCDVIYRSAFSLFNYILQFLYSDLPCTPEIWWFLSCALERDSWVSLILVKAYQLHFFDRRGHRPMFLEKRSLLVNENFWSSDITPRFHWNFLPCWTLKYPILSSPLFRSFTLLSLCKEEETQGYLILTFSY